MTVLAVGAKVSFEWCGTPWHYEQSQIDRYGIENVEEPNVETELKAVLHDIIVSGAGAAAINGGYDKVCSRLHNFGAGAHYYKQVSGKHRIYAYESYDGNPAGWYFDCGDFVGIYFAAGGSDRIPLEGWTLPKGASYMRPGAAPPPTLKAGAPRRDRVAEALAGLADGGADAGAEAADAGKRGAKRKAGAEGSRAKKGRHQEQEQAAEEPSVGRLPTSETLRDQNWVALDPSAPGQPPPPGSLPWAKDFLSRELWSLTLRSARGRDIPTETESAPRRYVCLPFKDRVSSSLSATRQFLKDELSKLRYPPLSIECWWRETAVCGTNRKEATELVWSKVAKKDRGAPSDLIGSLGVRPFPLRNNLGGPEARQPPHFHEHLLRPEQLRSLAWMLEQELPEAPHFGVEWRTFTDWQMLENGEACRKTKCSADVWIHDDTTGQREKECTLPAGTLVTTRGQPFVTGDVTTGFSFSQAITEPKHGTLEVKTLAPEEMHPVAQREFRVHGHYEVRGGILADRIGYGKTATTIGLIDSTLDKPVPDVPSVDRGRFKPVKATLILTPANLLDQWINEIGKFVHCGNGMRLVGGWGPKECPLKVFALKSVSPLKGATVKDIAQADIVICSYRLLYSTVYQARRDTILGEDVKRTPSIHPRPSLHDLTIATERAMQSRPTGSSHVSGDKRLHQPSTAAPGHASAARECANIDDLTFPLLEQFYWRRVVFDEFHELESFQSTQQVSLQHMRAHYRWGLTGTPPVGSNAGVIFMSSLFRVDLPGRLEPKNLSTEPYASQWEHDRLLTQMSLRFLDRFARQNAAELPEIPLEEEIVRVSHTTAERALYLGQAHDAPDLSTSEAFDTAERRQALQRLLMLCSHFQGGGGESAENATDECRRIGGKKERRSAKAAQALERCCQVLLLLEGKLKRLAAAENAALQKDLREFGQRLQEALAAEGAGAAEAAGAAVRSAALVLGAPEEAARLAADVLGAARGAQVETLALAVDQMLDPAAGLGDIAVHLAERLPDAMQLVYSHADEGLRGRLRERAASWRGHKLLPQRVLRGVEQAVELPPDYSAPAGQEAPGAGLAACAAEAGEATSPARAGAASPAPAPAPALAGAARELPEASAWRGRLRTALRALRDEGGGDRAPGRRAAAALERAFARAQREGPLQRLSGLEGHRASEESGLAAHLGPAPPRSGHTRDQWGALAAAPLRREELRKLMEAQADEQLRNLQELRSALASQDFFSRALSAMRENSSPEARSCSVCLEDDLPLTKLSITPCAHAFCTECLKATVKNFKSCSICRQALTEKDVVPISLELDARVEGAAHSSAASSSAVPAASSSSAKPALPDKYGVYGSKLARLVEKLQHLRLQDATAKAILFVQFDDLKRKVASALAEFGVPAALLQGSAQMRGKTIREWQENRDSSTFVLLLSLDESASGTNLTAASHVVFLHPMLAPTTETAAAFELQAIGRARRFGQRRDKVCVWRFVTVDTIEQELTERHQAALWARASGEAAASGAAPPAEGAAAAGAAAASRAQLEAQRQQAMREAQQVNAARTRELEEARRQATAAAQEAKQKLLEQRQREREALEATRRALREAAAARARLAASPP